MERQQTMQILKDLTKKMVLLTGPRQVGKTYLAKQIALKYQHPVYLNFDNIEDKNIIYNQTWLEKTDLLIFDEIHKMPDWKNYLKGIYDTKPLHLHLLVTGSARIELFDKLGDSLAGRYFLHRLLPLSVSELNQIKTSISIDALIHKGGFPEPYLSENLTDANRWRMQYINSLLSTDVFDFDKIQNIQAIRTIFELLRRRVGSTISYQSLARDTSVSPTTAKKYVEILEALYIIFRVTPYSTNIARSLIKEPKIYFYDTGLVLGDDGAKLENLVAISLLKHVYAKADYLGENFCLKYIRTKEGTEIDFVLVQDDIINLAIEVKVSDNTLSKSLFHFHHKYHFKAIQVVQSLRQEKKIGEIEIIKLENFLSTLAL
jgi:predicted AAA+ superfamily ATPase